MKKVESAIYEYLKERGWDKLRPSDLAKSISIESSELLEVFQWGSYELEQVKNDQEKMTKIKEELADVFIYALDMSVLLELDTEEIILDKIARVKAKYPAELMKKNVNGGSGSGENKVYLDIKRKHRRA